MPKIPSPVKAGCGIVFLFSSGVVTGVIGFVFLLAILIPRLDGWKSNKSKNFLAKRVTNQLRLTEAQHDELRPGFDQFLEKKWDRRADFFLAEHDYTLEYLNEIRPSLNPEQQKRADAMVKRLLSDKKRFLPRDKFSERVPVLEK